MNNPNETIIKLTILVICLITYAFFSTHILAMDKKTVKKSVEIDAPIKEVFSYATNPKNLPILMPNMKSVTAISPPTPGVGQSWYWEYKWMGTTLRGKSRVVKFDPPMRYVVESEGESGGENPDIWIYTLSKGDMGTKVTLEIEYTISSSVPTKIANRVFIERKIRGETQNSLEKLKTTMESNKYGKSGRKSLGQAEIALCN
jgi:uncharacterized membrane protein